MIAPPSRDSLWPGTFSAKSSIEPGKADFSNIESLKFPKLKFGKLQVRSIQKLSEHALSRSFASPAI